MSTRQGAIEDRSTEDDGALGELDATHFDEEDFDLTPVEKPRETARARRARAAAARRNAAARRQAAATPVAANVPAEESEIIRPYGAGKRRPLLFGEMPDPAAGPAARAARRNAILVPILAVLLVAAVVYGVFVTGRPAPTPTGMPTSLPTATATVDEARVKDLTDKVNANPKDVVALRGLTDEYYAAEQYDKAAQWQQKVVDLQPGDIPSHLVLAASLANSGDPAKAEAEWTKVTQLDPKQQEAWYNLGILHFSSNPPQEAKAQAEWAKVLEINPNTDLAKSVSNHMSRLPSGSATTGAGGAAGAAGSTGAPATASGSPAPAAAATSSAATAAALSTK